MHWHYPLALAAPFGCLLALLGLRAVAGAVRVVGGLDQGRVKSASDVVPISWASLLSAPPMRCCLPATLLSRGAIASKTTQDRAS
jgi:hypothetical protein